MENYIYPIELAALLSIVWLPVFTLAAILQWRLLKRFRARIVVLPAVFLTEAAVAFGIWLSPLPDYFPDFSFHETLSLVSIPLLAAILSAIVVTAIIWFLARQRTWSFP